VGNSRDISAISRNTQPSFSDAEIDEKILETDSHIEKLDKKAHSFRC